MSATKRITTFNQDGCSLPDTFAGLQEWIDARKNEVPEEYRDSAEIDIDACPCYDSAVIDVHVYYYRPETEEEEQERIGIKEKRRLQDIADLEWRLDALKNGVR